MRLLSFMKIRSLIAFLLFYLSQHCSTNAGTYGDNLWNVKFFGCDVSHDNYFILQRDGTPVCGSGNCPGGPGSCWGPIYTQHRLMNGGSYDWSVGSLGAIHIHHDRDFQFYGDTWLYVSAPKVLQVPFVADVGRMWLNNTDVTPNAVNDVIPLGLSGGWNHLEITTYNQNQGAQNEINFAFANQVERIASNTNAPATNNLPLVQSNNGWLFCGDLVQGNLTSSGQTNTYFFNANAGESVRLTLSDSTRAQIFSGTNYLGTFGYLVNPYKLTLPSTGTYTVFVTDYYGNIGNYNMSFSFVTPRCGLTLVCGQMVTNKFVASAQVDTYSFTGNAGEVAVVHLNPNGSAVAEVFDPSGNSIGIFGYPNGISNVTLPSTGIYTVLVRDYYGYTDGYSLTLAFATPKCGAPLSCGQTVTNHLATQGQLDIYTFTGNAGEVVVLHPNPNGSTRAQLFDPNGNSLGLFGYESHPPQVTLPINGTYTVFLSDYYGYTDDYSLSLGFGTPRCGTTILCGQSVTNHLATQAQLDTYKFTGNAGEVVRLIPSDSMQAQIFAPNGSYLGYLGYPNNPTQLTLPSTGTYIALLTDYYGYTGNYSVSLSFNAGCVQQQSAQVSGNDFHVKILGEVGRVYRVDTSTNLTHWSLGQPITFTNAFLDYVETNILQSQKRFYRAVLIP